MGFFDPVKKAFNWVAQRPDHNYTLGEFYQRHIQKKELRDVEANSLGFSRAGRLVERFHTVMGVTGAGFMIVTGIATGAAAPVAGAVALVAVMKGTGVLMGKLADGTFRGSRATVIGDTIHDFKESKELVKKQRYRSSVAQLKNILKPGSGKK